MSNKSGYSREGLSGNLIHYDSNGHKIGESRPSLYGGYTNYDAKGRKIGRSEEQLIGRGYKHYDNRGHKIGTSNEGFFGGYNNYDAGGHYTGHTDRSMFDIDENTLRRTGSMYHKYYDPPRGSSYSQVGTTPGQQKKRTDGNFSTGGSILIVFLGLVLTALIDQAADQVLSGGVLVFLWLAFSIGIMLLINWIRNGFHHDPANNDRAGFNQTMQDEWFDEEEESPETTAESTPSRVSAAAPKTARYIIARSAVHNQDLYFRTNEVFQIGELAIDTGTGERVEVLAAVECMEEALPDEAKTTRFAVRKI